MKHGIRSRLPVGLLVAVIAMIPAPSAPVLAGEGERAPEIIGDSWVNSPPLSMEGLGGRVVLVEFWTYG